MASKTIKEFYTPTCGYCPQQQEIIEGLVAEREDVEFETVDATVDPDEANRYGVRTVPTTVVFDRDGSVLQQFSGLTQAETIEEVL